VRDTGISIDSLCWLAGIEHRGRGRQGDRS
jgi:hypothetical protein